MSMQINKGAVRFKSLAQMARAKAKETGEPYNRVYIRMWKRLKEANRTASESFHQQTRVYTRKVRSIAA